jgi:hypothetical protein
MKAMGARGDAEVSDKKAGHVGGIGVATGLGDLGDGEGASAEEAFDLIESACIDIVGQPNFCFLMEQGGKVIGGTVHLMSEEFDAEFAFMEVFIDQIFAERNFVGFMLERNLFIFQGIEQRGKSENESAAML